MTNEEKAKELAGYDIDTPRSLMRMEARDEYDNLKKMAEWKDNQAENLLEEEIRAANNYYDKKLNQNMLYRHIGAITVLCRLLGRDFPSDRLHMNFITLD